MLFEEISEGAGNHREVFDKLPIIAGEAEKAAQFFGIGRGRP